MDEEGVDEPIDERLRRDADVHKTAWQGTIDDMEALAAEREEQGWRTVTVISGDTAPEGPEQGAEGRYGLVFVIPGNDADEFSEVFDTGRFPKYNVYREEVQGRIFTVVELLDPDSETAVLLAGNFVRRDSFGLVRKAMAEDKMYTHVHTLDGTHLGSFEHDGYEKFFPDAERIIEDREAEFGE